MREHEHEVKKAWDAGEPLPERIFVFDEPLHTGGWLRGAGIYVEQVATTLTEDRLFHKENIPHIHDIPERKRK